MLNRVLLGRGKRKLKTIIDFTLTPDDAIYSETSSSIKTNYAQVEIDLSQYAEGTYSGYLQIGNEQIVNAELTIPIDYPSQKLTFEHIIVTYPFIHLFSTVVYSDAPDTSVVDSNSANTTASTHFYMELNK